MAVKKAVFFTIDSLLASGIVIIAILLVSNFYFAEHQRVNVNYASQDLVRVFSTMTVGEVNNDYVESLIVSGSIINIDNTILEQIGQFWADSNIELAKNFSKNITEEIIPPQYGFSILVDGEEIYSRNLPIKKSLVSSRKLISGIAKAKPVDGFTARVLLSGIKSKKTSSYVFFGGYEGDGNLTKTLILPKDIISFDEAYLEVDTGGNFTLIINNDPTPPSFIKGSAGGSNTTDVVLADKWNISTHKDKFKSGENNISINFTSVDRSIAGGFLKVAYTTESFNGTEIAGYKKEFFPGIDGVINLYSGAYFPVGLDNVSIFLRFLSKYPVYLTIGNSTVFESIGSSNEQTISLNSSNISGSLKDSTLSYSFLSGKTVPIRLGLKPITVERGADSVLITDRTSGMSKCDVLADCSETGLCDTSSPCHRRRIDAAALSDKQFIQIVVNQTNKNNRVGMVGFGQDSNPVCDTHEFSNDNSSLINRTGYYKKSAYCGDTCVSCAVYSATQLLNEKEIMHGLKEIYINDSIYTNYSTEYKLGVGGFNSITFYFNKTIDQSKLVKARLSIFGNKVETDKGYQDCVYFNGRYLGRMCEQNGFKLDYHTCYFPLKPEWFNAVDTGKNNITVTAGTKTSCFGGTGAEDIWFVAKVDLIAWEYSGIPNSIYNATNNSNEFYDGVGLDGIQLNASAITYSVPFNINNTLYPLYLSENKTKIRASFLEFDAIHANPRKYNCVYVNGNYIGRVDWQRLNISDADDPQRNRTRVIFDVPAYLLTNGTNQINLTAGTSQDCKGPPNAEHAPWEFRNISLTVFWVNEPITYNRNKSMLVMSSGKAKETIGRKNAAASEARDEAVEKACEARKKYGISIFAVAMGDAGDAPTEMMQDIACCDDCSHYYRAESQTELLDIYKEIAETIASTVTFGQGQTAITGGGFERTILFPDSYIDFNYSLAEEFYLNKVPISFETERFGNNISVGNLTIYPNTTFSEGKVTSYSGTKWTDKALINDTIAKTTFFNLSIYGNYSTLGDPFTVNIPPSIILQGVYNVTISTGINSTHPTNGSPDNRVIYTLLLKGASDYSPVVAKSDGCSWDVEFEDGTTATIKVPPSYSGPDECNFAAKDFNADDALEIAVYELLNNLDLDKDGKLDVNIDANNLNIDSLTLSKVPSLWGPAIIEVRVWE